VTQMLGSRIRARLRGTRTLHTSPYPACNVWPRARDASVRAVLAVLFVTESVITTASVQAADATDACQTLFMKAESDSKADRPPSVALVLVWDSGVTSFTNPTRLQYLPASPGQRSFRSLSGAAAVAPQYFSDRLDANGLAFDPAQASLLQIVPNSDVESGGPSMDLLRQGSPPTPYLSFSAASTTPLTCWDSTNGTYIKHSVARAYSSNNGDGVSAILTFEFECEGANINTGGCSTHE
jgi:hypothetical protein